MRIFPFRYKLATLITAIVVSVVATVFLIVEDTIEEEFRSLVEKQLVQTEHVVKDQMEHRFEKLLSDVFFVEGDQLVRTLLTNAQYDDATRNDILSSEVFPNLVNADFVFVTSAAGKVKAKANVEPSVVETILHSPAFDQTKSGQDSAGYIYNSEHYFQFISLPIFIRDTMIGIATAGKELTEDDLQAIKRVSNIDITITQDKQAVIHTDWETHLEHEVEDYISAFEKLLQEELLSHNEIHEREMKRERFMLRSVKEDEKGFMPPYVVVQSLDKKLSFVKLIRQQIVIVAIGAVLVVIVLGFIFSTSISRPIKVLQAATAYVEDEDFNHRVEIKTKDEFSLLGKSFNSMIEGLEEKKKVREALNKSVSNEVAEYLLSEGVELGGEKREATIVFSDIRGFTSLSEQLSETELISVLNHYFNEVSNCIHEQKGTIDKFIGDAIMALFGIPVADEAHPYHAIMASISMIETLDRLNGDIEKEHGCRLDIGVGVNSGTVVAGLVGAENRLNYTALGDHVNLASRVEGLTKLYGTRLLVTEYAYKLLSKEQKSKLQFRSLDYVQVKGKTESCLIYDVQLAGKMNDSTILEFEQAYAAMREGRLEEAAATFDSLYKENTEDKVVELATKRAKDYAADAQFYERNYQDGVRLIREK